MTSYGSSGSFLADCPARFTIELLADKWTVPTLSALSLGPTRRSDLLGMVGGISGKVLTETLRRLESRGLVRHQRFAEAPPRVEYDLTPLGTTLLEPILVLNGWALTHGTDVLDASDRAASPEPIHHF